MFAISFDMVISDLTANYGNPYNRAYYEIKSILSKHNFEVENWSDFTDIVKNS
ncbi:hypothetical protein AGMMS50262_03370 [Bacteroidia bacterium]|nr:hypothetical protein AGMMS50262_03370 [Bacteroidia bacterium]